MLTRIPRCRLVRPRTCTSHAVQESLLRSKDMSVDHKALNAPSGKATVRTVCKMEQNMRYVRGQH